MPNATTPSSQQPGEQPWAMHCSCCGDTTTNQMWCQAASGKADWFHLHALVLGDQGAGTTSPLPACSLRQCCALSPRLLLIQQPQQHAP
jgi:hypothetical protein